MASKGEEVREREREGRIFAGCATFALGAAPARLAERGDGVRDAPETRPQTRQARPRVGVIEDAGDGRKVRAFGVSVLTEAFEELTQRDPSGGETGRDGDASPSGVRGVRDATESAVRPRETKRRVRVLGLGGEDRTESSSAILQARGL